MTDFPHTPTWHDGAHRSSANAPDSGYRNWIALIVFLSGLAGGFAAHELYKQNAEQHHADVWKTDRRADPSFRMDAPALAGLQKGSYVTRNSLRRWTSEWRTWGQVVSTERDFSVSLMSFQADRPYFHNSLVAELRNVHRLKKVRPMFGQHYDDLVTRHGRFRMVDLMIGADGISKRCIAFHSSSQTRHWYMKGWYCADIPGQPDPARVACLIDGVNLSSEQEGDAILPSQCQGAGKNASFEPASPGTGGNAAT